MLVPSQSKKRVHCSHLPKPNTEGGGEPTSRVIEIASASAWKPDEGAQVGGAQPCRSVNAMLRAQAYSMENNWCSRR